MIPYKELSAAKKSLLHEGTVIPAHPLALHQDLTLDEKRQRALTRYYIESGAGGVAVAVHTTQFEIRKPEINLFETVLRMAAEEIAAAKLQRAFLGIAGICGPTDQAIKEAGIAVQHNYDLGLLSMGGLQHLTETELLERTKAVAAIIPVFGFYLQPAVGGRILSYSFWKEFAAIENVHAIKVAAFNRYQTIDVIRAVAESDRRDHIALYTGNDDNIIPDLLTPYRFRVNDKWIEKRFVGGLLGHWAVWTRKAVSLLQEIKHSIVSGNQDTTALLTKGITVTDMNAALFDAPNSFKGCIAGIHEVLRRQGLMDGTWCLNKEEKLSPGQREEIDRIFECYPDLVEV